MWPFAMPPSFPRSWRCHELSLQRTGDLCCHDMAEHYPMCPSSCRLTQTSLCKHVVLRRKRHSLKCHQVLHTGPLLSPTVAGPIQVLLLGLKIQPGSRWRPGETLVQAQGEEKVRGAGQRKALRLHLFQLGHLLLQCYDLMQKTKPRAFRMA